MSTTTSPVDASTPNKYQPTDRLIDNPQRLRELYCERELTISEIAEEHATVGTSRVGQKLKEHGITRDEQTQITDTDEAGVDWSNL